MVSDFRQCGSRFELGVSASSSSSIRVLVTRTPPAFPSMHLAEEITLRSSSEAFSLSR